VRLMASLSQEICITEFLLDEFGKLIVVQTDLIVKVKVPITLLNFCIVSVLNIS